MTSASEQHDSKNESSGLEQGKTNNQITIKQIASIVKAQSQTSETEQDADIAMNRELIDPANQPPMKLPICYSINQMELLQQLGNHTFAVQYEFDEFMQKMIGLLKEPDITKTGRHPTP